MAIHVRVRHDPVAHAALHPRRGFSSVQSFASQIEGIAGKPAALWLPEESDKLTNVSFPDIRVWTHANTQIGRAVPFGTMDASGRRVLVTHNGTTDYMTTPDAADLSFGNGTLDSPFSAIFGGIITGGTTRTLIAKWSDSGVNDEYRMFASSGRVKVHLRDASAGVQAVRTADVLHYTDGVFSLNGFSYDGTGGATAADGISLYTNGALVPSVATNSATYVAMEDKGLAVSIAADALGAQPVAASAAFAVIFPSALSAAQHLAIRNLVAQFYGVSL